MDARSLSKKGSEAGWGRLRDDGSRSLYSVLAKSFVLVAFLLLVIFFWRGYAYEYAYNANELPQPIMPEEPPLLTYSQCMQQQLGSTAPEYIYTVVRHTDVNGEDLIHVQARDLDVVKKVCDLFPSCEGFNSNGWLKTRVTSHVPGAADLYIKSEKQTQSISEVEIRPWSGGATNAYNEMLQGLKIYVYETNIGATHRTVRSGGYGVEKLFIKQLSVSHLRTKKPEEATFYFLPIRCSSYILAAPLEHEGVKKAKRYIGEMLEQIRRSYPYWDRTEGADHFYVCAHDIGAGIGGDLLKNAIALVNTADYEDPYFVPHKDISLPPNPSNGPNSLPQIGRGGAGIGSSSRTILAYFAGDLASGRIRPTLRRYYIADSSFKIIDREVSRNVYLKYLRKSKFCLVPRGREVWSPRLMDAVFFGCIPVILSDHYHLPLQGIVDWKEFSVTVPESKVYHLKSILSSIPDSKIFEMQSKLAKVYTYFVWNNPAKMNDAFYSVMLELWQRRNVVRYRQNLPANL